MVYTISFPTTIFRAHEGRQEKQETPVLKEYPDPEVVSEAPDRLETPGTLATKATRETLELQEPRDNGYDMFATFFF